MERDIRAPRVKEQSPWFDHIPVAGNSFEIDIPGDQFSLSAIQWARRLN